MIAASDEPTELTATSNSTEMVTPVAGHDKMVSSAITSMSATVAGGVVGHAFCGYAWIEGHSSRLSPMKGAMDGI